MVDDPNIREAVMSSREVAGAGAGDSVDIYLSTGDFRPRKVIVVSENWLQSRLGAFISEAARRLDKIEAEFAEMTGVSGQVAAMIEELKRQ